MTEILPQVLRLLIKLYEGVANPDWVNICQCHMFLDDYAAVAAILHRLLKGSGVRCIVLILHASGMQQQLRLPSVESEAFFLLDGNLNTEILRTQPGICKVRAEE